LNTHFAQHIALGELPNRLHEFDIVVSCTASSLPIIGLGAVERALKARKRKPMFMVDLAVPRDIEPEVQRMGDVYLYTVDDLATLVQQGQASRKAAVAQAQGIIDDGVAGFVQWLAQRQAVPLIQRMNTQAETWREAELARAHKALARGDDVNAVLEALSKGLLQKALHGSYAALNDADPVQREKAIQAVERLWLRS
jgi:glutamyl-tRNA reductase